MHQLANYIIESIYRILIQYICSTLLKMYKRLKTYFVADYIDRLDSHHDKSRLNLLFNITFAVLLMGTVSTIVSLVLGTYSVLIPSIGNSIFALLTMFIMSKWRFQTAGIIYFTLLFVLLFGNINFNHGTMHVGAPFWIMLFNILVMYVLDKKWGIFFMLLSFFGFSYFIIFEYPEVVKLALTLSKETYYSAVYETLFALILLWYIIATILKASKSSDRLLRDQNEELLLQNEQILQRNHEKTVLLKEIHHRVKNNLQVIISLMRLQKTDLQNEEATIRFNEMINRVMTMAMIHEKVYQSDELSRVNLENYFYDLSQDLLTSYQVTDNVNLVYEFDLDKIGLKSIVPLALIFNELFSNSLKHAFEGVEHPEIRLKLVELENGGLYFEFTDNGHWIQPVKESSFGLELIDSLTNQLEGTCEFESEKETKYIFKFKNLDYD